MRHPSEYSTVPLLGCNVMVVDAGTEIKNAALRSKRTKRFYQCRRIRNEEC